MQQEQPLTLDHLVATIEKRSNDFSMLVDSFQAGKLEELYEELKEYAVTELLMLPLRRMMKDLPLVDDAEQANGIVLTIANILAALVGKPSHDVHVDMMEAVHRFPSDDVRQSATLRSANRLN